jgi:hypothetical protein
MPLANSFDHLVGATEQLRTIVSKTGCTPGGELEIRRNISAVAACCSRDSFSSPMSRAISVSCLEPEELLWRTFRVSALAAARTSLLAACSAAPSHRHPKAQDYADLQRKITAGICERRNGVWRSIFTVN